MGMCISSIELNDTDDKPNLATSKAYAMQWSCLPSLHPHQTGLLAPLTEHRPPAGAGDYFFAMKAQDVPCEFLIHHTKREKGEIMCYLSVGISLFLIELRHTSLFWKSARQSRIPISDLSKKFMFTLWYNTYALALASCVIRREES